MLSIPLETTIYPAGTKAREDDPSSAIYPTTRHILRYPSWGMLVDDAEKRTVEGSFPERQQSSRMQYNRATPWAGTKTYEEANTLARWGWTAGAEAVAKFGAQMVDTLSSLIELPVLRYQETPAVGIDVGRYVEGEPECFYSYYSETSHGNSSIVRIVYNCSSSAGISPQVLMAKGAAVAAVANLLTLAGLGVQVDIVDTAAGFGQAVEVWATAKAADEPLDLLTLAYAVAHPATGRRLMFAVEEGLPVGIRTAIGIPGGYGQPVDASDWGDIYVGKSTFGDVKWREPESAMRWVMQMLKEQGVSLKEEDTV